MLSLSDAFIMATLLMTFPIYPHFSWTLMTNFSRTGISHNTMLHMSLNHFYPNTLNILIITSLAAHLTASPI